MIEKRSFKIRSKIITPTDIRRIANLFYDIYSEYSRSLQKDYPELENYPNFEVSTTDGTEYSADTLDIFKSEGILDSKTVKEIKMSFRIYKFNTEVSIKLTDSRYDGWLNYIEVEGSDSTWVSGTFGRLLECVSSWQSQSSIGKGWRWLISIVIAFLVGFSIIALVDLAISLFSGGEYRIDPRVYYFSWTGVGFFWFIADYIAKLWPSIEIVTGPEHSHELQKSRKRISFIITAIVLPLVVGLLGNIIANIVTK
jgi:hypothetical protein